MHRRLLLALSAAGACVSSAAFGQTAPLAPIEQTALARDAFSTGLLDRGAGALGEDLWRGANAGRLSALLDMAPARPSSPSIGAALRRVLLSAGEAPQGANPALGGAKLKALARAGFIEEARQIESLASGTGGDPASVEAMIIADIFSGDTKSGCDKGRRVTAGIDNPFFVRLRIVCYAASSELDAAELALGILRETGRLGEIDEALLGPLASGGKPKAPVAPVDAVHFAALKAMGVPVSGALLDRADAGVVKAVAGDESTDWPSRLDAAKRAAAMGVMSGAELKSLFAGAPAGAAPAFQEIRAMSAPELMRDRAGRIAAEIASAASFEDLLAASILYADNIRETEGAILSANEAALLALARLAAGDAVGAERWLASAAAEVNRGVPDDRLLRYIDIVGVLGALEPAGAERVAAAANVAVAEPRIGAAEVSPPSANLAPVVAAAIDAAARGGSGEAALAALAASGAAAKGDPVAEAVVTSAFNAAGLGDIVRRRAAETMIAALFPAKAPAVAESGPGPAAPASAPDKMTPRLKPKRAT